MKKHFIICWIGGDKTYVKKTYCQRIVCSYSKVDARLFTKDGADKYLEKLKAIDTFAELDIRELA